jgi:hypothetical protein
MVVVSSTIEGGSGTLSTGKWLQLKKGNKFPMAVESNTQMLREME